MKTIKEAELNEKTSMTQELINLLNVYGVSGDEFRVRRYLKPVLKELGFKFHTDIYGNLLAEKIYGNGKGAKVILSAHMDTVKGVKKERELVYNKDIISSSVGALGADDRAGIAIILTVIRKLNKDNLFNGVVKLSFSTEEEVGCVGADNIEKEWYEGTDLAIVVDRRGRRDIVVGNNKAFCSDSVGEFMELVGEKAGMKWECVQGGTSDACVFSDNGINSVNVSAGYMNEHTEKEYVSLLDMKDTVNLISKALEHVNDYCDNFSPVANHNKWIDVFIDNYNEELFYGTNWAEERDELFGDVYAYEVMEDVIIQQGDNEIMLSKKAFRNFVNQLDIFL